MARKVQNTEVYRKDKTQIAVRLTAAQAERLDAVVPKGGTRASFARDVILRAIGWNEDIKLRKKVGSPRRKD